MTIEIPPELEWVSYLAGSEWPEGDEDAMFRIGGHWRNSADDLAKLIPDLNRVRQETIDSLSGDTANAADEQFKKLFDGDYSVDKLVDAMTAVGDMAWDQGTQIEYTKLQVLSTLAIVAAEIAWAIYNSWDTLGASLSWIPTFEGTAIAVIRQIAMAFLKRIRTAVAEAATKTFAVKALKMAGTGALHGVGIGLGQELAIQLYQESEGHRHDINWEQVGKVGLGGAVGGAVGALAHGPLATAFGPSNSIVGKAVKGTVVAFGSGVAGGVGGALAAGGGLDSKSIFGGAAGGAGSGAVHGAAGHGGEAHPTGGGPDGGPAKVPPPKVDVPDIDIKPDDIGPNTNVPEPPPPYSNVDSPPPTSSTAGPSDGGQDSADAGAGAGVGQNGASQNDAGQNSGAGQGNNGSSAGLGSGSGQSGASQTGAGQNSVVGQGNNGSSAGLGSGSGQSGASQTGAGQNSGVGQGNNGSSAGQGNDSGQSGASQNGAGQNGGAGQGNNGSSTGQGNGSGQSGASQTGAGQNNGAAAGQNSGAGQQNNGSSAGQSNGSGQSGVSQNGAGQNNGAAAGQNSGAGQQNNGSSTGQNSAAGQQNNGSSTGQSNGSGQSSVSQNGAGQNNGAAPGQNSGAGQQNNGAAAGHNNGPGQSGASQNGAGQNNAAAAGQNSGAGQQNNGSSAGQSNGSGPSGVSQNGAAQSNGSGPSGVSQNGAAQSNGAAAAQNSGAGQPNNGSSTGQQSAQVGDGARPPGARPNVAGMDGRGPGAGGTQLSATPHTDTRTASAGTRKSAIDSTGGPNSTKAVPGSASDGPQSNSASRPPSTGKPDAGREGSKSQEKDQPAVDESPNPRTSPAEPQGNRRTADGISSRPARTSDSSTPDKHQHDESNAPKRLFIGSSPHESSTAAMSTAGSGHSGGTRASSPDVDPHRGGDSGGTRASSPDVDPHRGGVRDDAGPSREEQVHSRPLPSPPDVVPHRGGDSGGTRASSPDVDPHRGGVRDDAGPSREEQVHSRPLPSPPDVVPHRGGDSGGTRASSPDVDPHRGGVRDDAGPSREEQVHSRPLPSPPDVPALAPLGGSNTSIHWIRSWIGDVNPGYNAAPVGDPRRRNCTSASIAVFRRLSGTSNDPAGLEELYSHQVAEITDLPLVPTTLDQVEQALRDAGPGSHTIVAARFDGRPSHAFNAYFDGRNVHGLDGQSGVDELWPPDSYIFHPAHPPTQLFMGTPYHGTREQMMRGAPDRSESDSSDSRSGHDSGAPNRPPRDQMQANHPSGSNHIGKQSFSSGSGDHAMRPGASGQTTSHGSTFAAADSSHRSASPDGGPGDAHGSDTPARSQGTSAGSTGRDTRPAPIAGPDNGSGHRGGGVRDVSGGDSGSGLKRGRDDSGDGADGNSDVSRHGKRVRIDTGAAPEVGRSTRHPDTDMDVDRDGHHDPESGSSRDTHPHTVGDDDGMAVDHVDHRGPVAGTSHDTQAHAASADDVEMADGTVHDQVDDLARRLGELQVDKETQFNSKFADLVSSAKGGNSAADDGGPGKSPYDDYVQTSVDEDRPVSFVVNAVVGADPVPDLKGFVDAVTNNAKDLNGKVAFVIGVNARDTPEGRASVDEALADMKGALDTIDHPVALTGFTWKMPSSENVPFGTMRNSTLHSEANHLVIDALWSKGTHPYIAVQDFDTGSRNVPSGKHIFNHVIDSMTVGDGLPPSRPLMFGGGYRLGEGGKATLVSDTHDRRVRDAEKDEAERDEFPTAKKKLAAQIQEREKEIADLEAQKKAAPRGSKNDVITPSGKTVKDLKNEITKLKKDDGVKEIDKLAKNIAKLNEATKNKIDETDFVADLDRRITQDMDTRVVLAKTNPLLPYTPEPNLFVDAIATKLHSDIKFGNGAAEFSHLGEKLQEAYAKELGEFHDHQTDGIKNNINEKIAAIKEDIKNAGHGNPISLDQARALIKQDPELMNAMREIENQRSNLEVDAQNNRHPVRGEVFITDFKGAAVETDLSRLALGYAHKNIVPQSHTDLTGVADRFFDGKTAKKGTSFSGFRDQFPNHAGNLREPTNLGFDDKGIPERTYTPDDKTHFVPKKGEQQPAKTVAAALGLGHEVPGQGEKKAAGVRGEKKEALDQGDEEAPKNTLSKAISTPVPSRDHEGVVAGISPQPKKVPGETAADEKTPEKLDHHKAFAAVNTAMSGPEALMQRKFGALGNIANLPETLPPAKGGLFDAVAGPRGDSAELRQRVTNFVSSLTSSTADTRVSTKLADFITDHPTTDGDLVNAIIQPGKPAAFAKSPGWQHHPESTQDAGKTGATADPNPGTGPEKDAEKKKQEADAENEQRKDDAETATNAEHIAVKVLATTLEKPIHVHEDGEITKYAPFEKKPSKVDAKPITVYATKQDNGRYTYSATAPAPARSARSFRPAPEPLAGGVGAGFGGGGIGESKVLHGNDSGSHDHRAAVGTGRAPSETPSTTVGGDRGRTGGGERVVPPPPTPPPAPPRPAASSSGARVVRGGGAPPRLAVSGGSRGGDVLDDESWRHDPATSADWFDPKDPVSPDVWAAHRGGAHVRTVNAVVADIRSDSTPSQINAYDGRIKYDLRRIEVEPGKFVQDYTLKVHLAPGSGVDAGMVEAVQAKAKAGVDSLLNQGFRMPSGDQFHVNLEFADDPKRAHTRIEVGGTHTDQTHWNPTASSNVLAHETLHYLGVPDEYTDRGRVLLAHDTNSGVHQGDGGMMGRAVLGDDPGLRPRHLWLIERTANSQAAAPGTRRGDPHGSDPTAGPHGASAGSTGRDTRPAPIAGPDNGSGHRGGGVRDVSGGDSGSGLKRGRDESGDGADGNSDVSRHGKRARIDTDASPEVADPNRHPDTDMVVDRDGHHDPEAGTSRDTHPHAGSADDVEMADHTADALAQPFQNLHLDGTTRVNQKFTDLVGGHEDALPTKGTYLEDLQRSVDENRPISFVVNTIVGVSEVHNLKAFVESVMENAAGLHGRVAFVVGVNTRDSKTAHSELDKALADVAPELAALDHPVALTGLTWKTPSRNKFPYGTIRNDTMHSKANEQAIAALWSKGSHPYIAVQDFDTGSRNVPSGKHIFNHVIDSMTVGEELPPSRPLMFGGGYRMGDGAQLVADTKARIERELAKTRGELADAQTTVEERANAEGKPRSRKGVSAKRIDTLNNDIAMLEKASRKIDEAGFTADFARQITRDMDTRVELAKTHPMLPYTPEPNLFIDAIPALDPDVKFGNGAAEFEDLGRSLHKFHATELGAVYDQKLANVDRTIREQYAKAESKERFLQVDLKEHLREHQSLLSNLAVDAQTYRHPIRGAVFISDFEGAAVETDLSRIALGYAGKGVLAQSHAVLTNVADRFFDTTAPKEAEQEGTSKAATDETSKKASSKTAKKGTSLATFRDKFPKLPDHGREPINIAQKEATQPAQHQPQERGLYPLTELKFTLDADLEKKLGAADHNLVDPSMSMPVPNHEGVVAGIRDHDPDAELDSNRPSQKTIAAINAAMSGPGALMQRNFGLLNSIAKLSPAPGLNQHGLFTAVGEHPGVATPADLRHQVTKYVASLHTQISKGSQAEKAQADIRQELADYLTDHPTTNGDLVNSIIQPAPTPKGEVPETWKGKPADGQAEVEQDLDDRTNAEKEADERQEDERKAVDKQTAANAEHVAAQVLATHLATPIRVRFTDGTTTEYQPFGKGLRGKAPIEVHAKRQDNGLNIYSDKPLAETSDDAAVVDPKTLHDKDFESGRHETPMPSHESPSETLLKAFGAQRSSLEQSFGAPGDRQANWLDHFGNPAEVPTADRGQQLVEARNAELRLEAGLSEGRQHIAELSGRLAQVDNLIADQHGVVEEANRRLAGAVDHLQQLQTQERLIAERPVDENTLQRATEQTQSQQRVADAEEGRARKEHDSLERLNGESALIRQQLAHDEQRLAEVEAQLSRARQDTAELARPQVVSRERFPEHSLEAIRLFRDNYPQLRDLNAVHFNAGVQDHMHNCVNVVVSTFETLSGRRMVPHGAPSGRSGDLLIEHFDREHHMVSGPQEIVETLVQAGPGSQGVVFQHRAQGEGHVFNALYDERLNSVVFIDAQNGRLGSFDPNDRYGFMLVTGDHPDAPRPMDVDTAFSGPKIDFTNVSHESITENNVEHGFGDDHDGRHQPSPEGNSQKRRFEPDEDSELPEPQRWREQPSASASRVTATAQPHESSGASAPTSRSTLSGVPSAASSHHSSDAPVARTADAPARRAENLRTPQGSRLLTTEEVHGPQHESVDVVNPTERTGAGEAVSRPAPPDVRKPDPQLPARIGDHLVLGGTDVLEEFRSGEEGARDQGFEYIKQLVLHEGSEEVWQKNEMEVYGLFSDRGLRPEVPGMLRGGQTVKHVIHLTKDRSLTVNLRLDGAHQDSKLEYKGDFKNEFEHTSDSTSSLGRSAQSRVVYHAGVQGSIKGGAQGSPSQSAGSDTAALIASRAHDSGSTEVRADRQISGAQTAEAATRFRGRIQASIDHWFSDSPKVVHEHELAYHTQVAVPTRDVNDRGEDVPPSEPPDGPSAPPRVEYTRALSSSDAVTNLWMLPDKHDSAQPRKHGDTEPDARTPRGPRPQKIPDFVMDKPMRTAFEKAYGKGSAQLAIDEAGKWLTVERLQANLHGMTNKQPLVLEFESIPGARLEVHAFVEPLDTASDTKSVAGRGDVTNPKSAQPMMRPTGETKETEFHFGTETDTSQARVDAVTVTYQAPVPGRARGEGGTDTGQATGGMDANVARGNVHSDTESRQFRIRSTLKNPAAGQAWHGQARLRFVMHDPDAVSPSHLGAPFRGAVHETRARFDVLAEKSETTPTRDYTDETVYAPPERIWGQPPGERNSVAKSPWWRIGTGHRTVRMKDGQTRAAYQPAPESIPRGEETAPLRGLGSMDRVTNLDVSGLHGMLDSMGRRAFGNDWKDVRSEVSSWHHLNRIRAALPAMTQHSPLTRTKLSGPNSKTKVSFTADIEQLTYKRTIKTLSSPSMEITEGSASTTERSGQVSVQGALGGKGGDVNGGSVLGEAMAGATETVRDSERVRDQQRVAVGTKFDQPMAIFEGWVRLDGTMTGSKSTVHESGLFPVEIAIPLTELQGSRTHYLDLPPTFTRDKQTGFIDEPRPKLPPVRRGDDGRDAPYPRLADAAGGFKPLPPMKLPPSGWEWTAPAGMEQPPEPPAHALLGSWHPSDMLIGLDPASGLLEAMRHDLAPALGSSLDDAVDNLAGQFGPRVLAARLTHQSGQEWSHDIPVAGGKITVKVRPVREAEAEYVGSSSKFETDFSIESQSSAAQGHGASLRTNEGFRVQIPVPHGSVSFGGQHSGSVRPREDPGGTRLSGLNTPTYTGEIEHRVPVRTRATEAHDLFRQPIRFKISYEKHGAAKLLKDTPASPQPVRLNGVFSYPKKTPTAVDPEDAGAPPAHLEVRQAVVKIRPHGDTAPTHDSADSRSADEDQMATHILDSMEASGEEVFGKEKWPSVRAELAEHVKTMAVQAKLGDYTRGETKTINLTSVRGGKVVLGAHLDAMYRADSNATTEFYSGGQQLLTAGVSKSKGNNWQGFIQAQADLLPTGDTVNVSALARLGGGVGSETQDTRTNNTATGTMFRKKVPTLAHVGTVTITAEMTRPGADDRSRGVGSAKLDFVTRESPTDKQAHASHVPRDGIIQNDADGAPSDNDEQRGPHGTDVPQRGLSDESIVRKLVDGEQFRSETLKALREYEIKDANEVVDGLTDTLVASKLGEMTRVHDGDGIQLVRHGKVRIYGRAAVQKLDFDTIEHEGGNAYVLNDVNQTRVDQHTATREGNARLMIGPHGDLAPGVSAYLLAGGGVGGRERVDAISSQTARVAANEKFARSHAVFDGTTRITLTVRDGETPHELDPIDVHGPILIPESETHPVDAPPPDPEPIAEEPKEEVPEELWLGALGAVWAESGDEPASNPPRASLSAGPGPIVNRPRTPAGSPIARTVNTPDVQ